MPELATRDGAHDACRRALEDSPELQPLVRAYRTGMPELTEAVALVGRVRPLGRAVGRLAAIRAYLTTNGIDTAAGAFERFVLLAAALTTVDKVAMLPVDRRVKELFYRKFKLYASGTVADAFDLTRASFVAASQLVSLHRYPAGQLDWVVAGVPRSWLLRVPTVAMPRLLHAIVFGLGGFAPAFFTHLDPHRPNQGLLLERESLRSYHRMAASMAMQPGIKGLITASWFHSPDTFLVSPHLAWVNEVFLQHGGQVFPLGPVDPGCGVLHRSPERQRAFDEGRFVPTEALVIWPRRAMLAWAAGRPDLGEVPAASAPSPSLAGARA